MPARSAVMAVYVLLLATICPAQEAAKPAVDRKDPEAVAAGFVAALDASDAEAAKALLAGDDEFRDAWLEAVRGMTEGMGEEGMTFRAMLTETSFLPVGWPAGQREMAAQVQNGEATISLTERNEVQRKLILTRADDGTWSVDFLRSVTATTGMEHSFFVDDAMAYGAAEAEEAEVVEMGPPGEGGPPGMGAPGGGGPPGMGGSPGAYWDSREMAEYEMGHTAQIVLQWAEEHDGMLPPAATWLEDSESWQLEPAWRAEGPVAQQG